MDAELSRDFEKENLIRWYGNGKIFGSVLPSVLVQVLFGPELAVRRMPTCVASEDLQALLAPLFLELQERIVAAYDSKLGENHAARPLADAEETLGTSQL